MGQILGEGMAQGGPLLFGRRTYEDFAAYWPNQPEPNPFTAALNNVQKYVASGTRQGPWKSRSHGAAPRSSRVTRRRRWRS
jgi:hypothetical protein